MEQYASSSYLFPLPSFSSFSFPSHILSFFGFLGSWRILIPISFLIAPVGFPSSLFLESRILTPCRVFPSRSYSLAVFSETGAEKRTESTRGLSRTDWNCCSLHRRPSQALREATPLETHISPCNETPYIHIYITRYLKRWQP